MIHAVWTILSADRKLKKYLKECCLEDDCGSEDRFFYQKKYYDREKFITLVQRDFEKLPVRDRILEVKCLVEGLESSVNRELDLAYIEAYRRTLEGTADR